MLKPNGIDHVPSGIKEEAGGVQVDAFAPSPSPSAAEQASEQAAGLAAACRVPAQPHDDPAQGATGFLLQANLLSLLQTDGHEISSEVKVGGVEPQLTADAARRLAFGILEIPVG